MNIGDFSQDKTSRQILKLDTVRDKARKILVKKYQTIAIDQKKLIVRCIESDQEPTTIRTTEPFNVQQLVSYFQMKIVDLGDGDHRVYIGLINKDTRLRKFPGTSLNSIGFAGTVIHYHLVDPESINTLGEMKLIKVIPTKAIKANTILGIGLNTSKKCIFFTIDGEKIKQQILIPDYQGWNQFYPSICVSKEKDTIQFVFAEKHFKFDLQAYVKQEESELYKDIIETDCLINSQATMFSLVQEYLTFHGFHQTLNLLKKQRPYIFKLGLAESSVQKNKIALGSDIKTKSKQDLLFQRIDYCDCDSDEQDEDFKYLSDDIPSRMWSMDEQVGIDNINRKYSDARHNKLKNPKQEQKLLKQKTQLFQQESNLSVVSEQGSQLCLGRSMKTENKLQPQLTDFLQNDRVGTAMPILEIMKYIRQQKIESAIKLMKETIAQIFQAEDYIEAFMKGHIFLRKIRRQSLLTAVKYAKEEKCFLKYQNNLFPVYSLQLQDLNWIPFRQIFTLIANNRSNEGCLTDGQFYSFSLYINELILKKLGFVGMSRLDACVKHIEQIQATCETQHILKPQFKIDK